MGAKRRPGLPTEEDEMSRKRRIPPGQTVTDDFPVLHHGSVPEIDLATWRFRIFGRVEEPLEMTYDEFRSLPSVTQVSDFHCVTTWSRLDNRWEGVASKELMKRVRLKPEARFVMVHAAPDFTANLPLEDFLADGVLFAWAHDRKELTPEHGWPLRLVVPHLYAWKSAKWVTGLEFMAEDRPGFWERRGYHPHGDPWAEERYGV